MINIRVYLPMFVIYLLRCSQGTRHISLSTLQHKPSGQLDLSLYLLFTVPLWFELFVLCLTQTVCKHRQYSKDLLQTFSSVSLNSFPPWWIHCSWVRQRKDRFWERAYELAISKYSYLSCKTIWPHLWSHPKPLVSLKFL